MTDATKYTAKLQGSRVLVVGGTSGIGFGVAEACVEHGATVIVSSSTQAKIDATVNTLISSYPSAKGRVSGIPCDLADLDNQDSNVAALFEKVGKPLNHVVFTAGDAFGTLPLDQVTPKALFQKGAVRFFGAITTIKHAKNYLEPSVNSSITITSGTIADHPSAGAGAINGFITGTYGTTRGFALDLAPIRVNCVSPGLIQTPLIGAFPPAVIERYEGRMATKAIGKVEDVVEAYLYLMKDKNVTGHILASNGGALLT